MFSLPRTTVASITARFVKYSSVGLATFALDMGIIFLLTQILSLHYALATSIGFLIGLSINYLITYHYVFTGTQRKKLDGYVIFILFGLLGMTFITSFTVLLVETFGMQFFIARCIVGAVLGTVGFFVNALFNFKML